MPISPAVLELADNAAASANAVMQRQANVIDALVASGVSFTDENGNRVKLSELRNKISNHRSAVAFGFNGCTEVCDTNNQSLRIINEKTRGGLVSIVIAVKEADKGNRTDYMNNLKDAIKGDVVLLFPDNIKADYPKLTGALGLTGRNPDNHTSFLVLSEPGGKIVKRIDGLQQGAIKGQTVDQLFTPRSPEPPPALAPAPSPFTR